MWSKIRSSFILKKIFLYISNKKKFNTIVYNKELQKKLGLNLYDFIRFSDGKFKKGKNTICLYNIDESLIYEGDYLNNKKNGYGKEYNEKGKLIYEGDYINDKKWTGTEKIYDEMNSELIFGYRFEDMKMGKKSI